MTDSRTLGQSVPKEGLFLMDGIEGLRSLPKHSVDMLLTDPPYGTTRNYWDVPLPLPELWEAVKWAVKPNGAVLFFAQCPFDKVLGASNLAMLHYEWIWYKERGTGFLNANRVYGDNVIEKHGINRDRTGDGEKTRCLCGKRGIFDRDGPAMGPQIIRQLERRASRRSASFFHALASPGRPRNGGGASGAYQPAEGRKTLIQGHFQAQEGPLGPSRKSQQQTKRTGFAALEDSIADEAPEGKRAKRANGALIRA